jgi:hypothetical protein
MPARGHLANATSLTGEFSGSGLRTPSVAQTPLSTLFSGAGSLFSEAWGSPSDLMTQDRERHNESLCSFLSGKKNLYFPLFLLAENPFLPFISPQNPSRDQNFAVAGGGQNLTNTRKIPSYGSPNSPRRQVQKVPLRRDNRTIAHHCCHSAISAKTLLLPSKPPQNTFCTEGCGFRGAGAGAPRPCCPQ